jgi:tetratricopeptide (TPR) repeat protein
VIEISLLRFYQARPWRWGNLSHFYGLLLWLPLAVLAIFLLSHPGWFEQASAHRAFSPWERLLTESRVLVFYLRLMLLPSISEYGLFYDDFPISHSLFDPLTTLAAVGAWLVLVVGSLLARRRAPVLAFAVCWSLAGHALESSFVPLELVHLHRNYLACLGPIIGFTVGVFRLTGGLASRWRLAVLPAIVLALGGVTALRADQWRDDLTLARFELLHRPNSPRAQYEGGRVLAELAFSLNSPALKEDGIRHLRRAAELAPDEISALVGIGIIAEGPFPEDVFQELSRRLERRPVNPVDINYLRTLTNCRHNSRCKIPPAQIQALFGMMLNHPRVTPAVTSQLLSLLGLYYASDLGDVEASARLLREAVALQPEDIQIRLNLAQALLFLPDYAGAEKELSTVESLDAAGRQALTVRNIRRDLEKMKTSATDHPQR